MRKSSEMSMVPVEAAPRFPELYTDADLTSAGEVVSTTAKGQIFVKVDDRIYLFQPVARIHGKKDEYYYNRVEFE